MNTIDAGRRKLIVVTTGLGVKFLKGGYPFPGSGNPFGYLTRRPPLPPSEEGYALVPYR